MKITTFLFEAFLKCPTKCHLRSLGETGSGNEYAEWERHRDGDYQCEGGRRLMENVPESECVVSPLTGEVFKTARWRLALNAVAHTPDRSADSHVRESQGNEAARQLGDAPPQPGGSGRESAPSVSRDSQSRLTSAAPELESRLHAIERIPSEGRGKAAQFIPIRFIWRNKLTKDDRLLLAFDALVLSQVLGREVSLGKIIHGDEHATLKVKLGARTAESARTAATSKGLAAEVRKRLDKITALLSGQAGAQSTTVPRGGIRESLPDAETRGLGDPRSGPAPPDLVLNRHCAECEFQARCRKIAVEKDDLSLLGGMSEMERLRHRSKGIFTVTQLSYTFRPRRTPKRAKNPAKPRYLALQALAIRENTVYIHGTPTLPQSTIRVYLDIEGLPDRDFHYLIGALVVADGNDTFHSFWADTQADEADIFTQFIETLSQLENCRVFHFGDYDTVALKRVKSLLSESHQAQIDLILAKCTNVLSAIYPHVYFPTFSNSLKDIGRFLGPEYSADSATGLQSVMWRSAWESARGSDLKSKLVYYNRTDCLTLKRLTEFIVDQTSSSTVGEAGIKIDRTEKLRPTHRRWQVFARRDYALEDSKSIVKSSYFDYQREKVFVRTDRELKTVNKRHRKLKRTCLRPNSTQELKAKKCTLCGSKRIEFRRDRYRLLFDLKFTKSGVKKWIIRTKYSWYYCSKCKNEFNSWDGVSYPSRYGHGLMSWCVYMNVVGGMNMGRIQKALGDLFGLFVTGAQVFRFKRYIKTLYESLYVEIQKSLLAGPILHIDETGVNLRRQAGYVWVMAGMDKVHYLYRPSREGDFLEQMLGPFHGILISDFFTAYDSLPCRQQKCLAHLIRDIDDDLFHNPPDSELKSLAHDFGRLLKSIISTVDKFGLKRRHLHKHEKDVLRFMKSVGDQSFSSQIAIKYQKRFERSGSKMFTFLEHDGVPWNNTNAEHAIKAFAKYRHEADGRFAEATLKDYLVLASVFETCAFNNVNVLRFLLSKETTLDGLMRMAGRKSVHGTIAVRVITASAERQQFDSLLKVDPFRGPRVPVGERLYQVAEQDGKWVGLLLWCAPALRLRGRDAWIGWDTFTRRKRRKLIVSLARFIVPNSARRPGLASQILAAAATALPDQWFAQFGYAPLLAETLTDLVAHAGTCYKAADWIPVRFHQHCNSRAQPKRIWLKLLDPQGKEKLLSAELSVRHAAALNTSIVARCALDGAQRSSLKEALCQVPDPRGTRGKRYPLAPALTIIALGVFAGKIHHGEIQRVGARLSHGQRRALSFRRKEGTKFYPAPTSRVLRRLLTILDLDAMTDVLTRWLQSQAGLLPSSLTLDPKTIRDRLDCILSHIVREGGARADLIAVSSKGQEPPASQ